MGGNPDKDPPFFFTKPPDAAVDVSAAGAVVHFPPQTQDLQHEVEMVVAIGRGEGPIRCADDGTAVASVVLLALFCQLICRIRPGGGSPTTAGTDCRNSLSV